MHGRMVAGLHGTPGTISATVYTAQINAEQGL